MNIEKFKRHVASRRAMPVHMETKQVAVEMPPACDTSTPVLSENKCKCQASLPHGTIEGVGLEGKRQWIRLRVSSRWLDEQLEHLGVQPSDTLYLSRYTTDYHGKQKPPLRVFSPDMELLDHRLRVGDVVKCAFDEIRTYEKNGRQCCAELHRNIVLVKKNKKRPRVVGYFSDGDD